MSVFLSEPLHYSIDEMKKYLTLNTTGKLAIERYKDQQAGNYQKHLFKICLQFLLMASIGDVAFFL